MVGDMVHAICLKCGTGKVGAMAQCPRCAFIPQKTEDKAKSILLSDRCAKMAVLEFAGQFVKAVECPGECKLPERITSVSRQGVSFQVFDPQDFMNEGRTGLYTVDIFLKSVNPDRAQKRARVFSPDMPQAHRKTYPRVGGW